MDLPRRTASAPGALDVTAPGGAGHAGPSAAPSRLHWIDWLRVAAIGGVFLYHTLRPFNTNGWHIKNAETSAELNMVTTLFSSFGLAVLFLLAGIGVRFALRKRSWRTFIRERTARLVVPFLVGTLLLSPLQGWFEAVHKGLSPTPTSDFFGWWGVTIGWATDRGISPTAFGIGFHLWFLGFLFAISVIALPLCLWLLRPRGRALVEAIAARLTWPGSTLVFVVPIYLLMGIGTIFGTEEHDWFEFTWYFAYFVAGFVLLGDDRLIGGVRRDLAPALVTAVVTTGLIVAGIPVPLDQLGPADALTKLTAGGLFALEGWAWTLVLLNVGLRLRAWQGPVRPALGDAVLPVYVIHQPVIVAVAFWVVAWPVPMLAKWLAILAISVPVTFVLVELALRAPVLRFLLGTRSRQPSPVRAAGAAPAVAPVDISSTVTGHGGAG